MRALTLALVLLAGCPKSADTDTDAGTDSDVGTEVTVDTEADTEPDSDSDTAFGATCDALAADLGVTTGTGPCVQTESLPGGATEAVVRADCTDPALRGHLDKRHVVMVPQTPTRDVVWLHLGGSGGQPVNSENIGMAAVSEGYRYIGLAYLNEPDVASRCTCPDGPRPIDCELLVRLEVLYGTEHTPWFDMVPAESIHARLVALLTYLADERPDDGWEAFLTVDGEPDWTHFAVSGFSQGGGMAGLIARDHAVDRALYFSKGAGGGPSVLTDPSSATPCTAHEECAPFGLCCTLAQGQCEVPDVDAICLIPTPAPWVYSGVDTDGDGFGEGGAEARATPGSRSFALIHRDEGAWGYSPETFAAWGLGTRDDYVDADTVAGPFDPSVHLFSTARPPRLETCSEHQSMGSDACQPRRADGKPAMWDAWRHAMSADLSR